MLSLENVSKTYGRTLALAPLDLRLAVGKTTVVIGPSGCGKSTLMGLMIGLIRPDQGTVRFGDTELTAKTAPEIRHRTGYVIQDGGLFPHMDARNNIILMARQLGWERTRINQRLNELIELTHFPSLALARYPVELSGGQRQRVSLMRALMLDPELLLLDEPLGALDPMIRFDLQNELSAIFEALKKTVVLVTHDIGEAGFFADTIALMRDGYIVQIGTLDDLVRTPADPFVTRFIQAQRTASDQLGGA